MVTFVIATFGNIVHGAVGSVGVRDGVVYWILDDEIVGQR